MRSAWATVVSAVAAIALVLRAVEIEPQPAPFAFDQHQTVIVSDADHAYMRQTAVGSSIDCQVAGLRRRSHMITVILEDGLYLLALANPVTAAGEHPAETVGPRIGPSNPEEALAENGLLEKSFVVFAQRRLAVGSRQGKDADRPPCIGDDRAWRDLLQIGTVKRIQVILQGLLCGDAIVLEVIRPRQAPTRTREQQDRPLDQTLARQALSGLPQDGRVRQAAHDQEGSDCCKKEGWKPDGRWLAVMIGSPG